MLGWSPSCLRVLASVGDMSNANAPKPHRPVASNIQRSETAVSGTVRIDLPAELAGPRPERAQTSASEPKPIVAPPPAAAGPAERGRALRKYVAFVLDRALLVTSAVALVTSASTFVLHQEGGFGGEATMRKLTRVEMPALSPLLVTGDVRIDGADQQLHGWISGTRWRALAPDARRSAAEGLAANLSQAGIATADLYDHDALVLVIRDGELRSAPGLER